MTGVEIHLSSDMYRGAAWLSSARVVRCWLSPATSATLTPCCYQIMLGTLGELPVTNRRKVGMTSNQHGPYVQGYTRATMAGTMSCDAARWSKSQKTGLSSDWSLQLDSMKLESLVIGDQHAPVNTFPGLVHTARHTTRVGSTRRGCSNHLWRKVPKVKPVRGVKS